MAGWGDRLAVAAVNGPAATVVSGEPDALGEFEAELSARHAMRWRVPETDFVAHSSRVAELAEGLAGDLASIQPVAGRVRLFSTALGRWMDGTELDAGYWYDNVRRTVRFEDAIRALAADGYRTFIEVSPHPTLEAAVEDTIDDTAPGAVRVVCGTLHRDFPALAQISTVMARGFGRGIRMNWAAMLGAGRRVDLPTYAFQHQRYWPEGTQLPAPAGGDGPGTEGEARFWAAVEGGDLQALAQTLAVDDQRLGEVHARAGLMAAPGAGPVGDRGLAVPDHLGTGDRTRPGWHCPGRGWWWSRPTRPTRPSGPRRRWPLAAPGR